MLQLHTFVVRASLLLLGALALACAKDPASGRRHSGVGGAGGAGASPSGGGGASGGGAGGLVIAGEGGGSGASGESGAGAGGAGGTSDGLSVHIEDGARLAVEIVTVSCPGECVEVKAVARGGQPAYHFEWEDGSTSDTRMLCPEADSMHEVTVTDTGTESEEFGRASETAKASVDTRVLECPVEEPSTPDAGAGDECETDSDCGAGQTCFEGICVGEGGLRFSLTWNVDTDFDLFVRMPDGRTEISYIFKEAGGGMLDVDDCFEGCRIPGGPHVENIFFEGEPPRGTYTYWVVNSGLVESDDFWIEISAAGEVQAMQAGTLAELDAESDRYTFEY